MPYMCSRFDHHHVSPYRRTSVFSVNVFKRVGYFYIQLTFALVFHETQQICYYILQNKSMYESTCTSNYHDSDVFVTDGALRAGVNCNQNTNVKLWRKKSFCFHHEQCHIPLTPESYRLPLIFLLGTYICIFLMNLLHSRLKRLQVVHIILECKFITFPLIIYVENVI